MAVAQTKAASFIQEQTEEISSHRIISLLMEGALERVDQSLVAQREDNPRDLEVLLNKLVAIINGLKNSLNMSAGGDIASNLDALYQYMIERITQSPSDKLNHVLVEIKDLIGQVKQGWDQMDFTNLETPVSQ